MASVSFKRLCLAALGCWAVAATSTACSEGSDGNSGTGGTASTTGGTANAGGETGTPTSTGGTATSSLLANPTNLLYGFSLGNEGIQAANPSAPAGSEDITAQATLSQDSAVNAPCLVDTDKAGSLKIEAPFNAYGTQRVDYQFLLPGATDYSGRTLYLWLRWDSGFNPDPSAPGGIIFYGKSGTAYTWGQAAWMNLIKMGEWQPIKFDLANQDLSQTTSVDPTQLMAFGFQLNTGGTIGVPSSNGSVTTLPTPAVFHVDCIGWTPNQ